MRLLELAGERCQKLMDSRLHGLKCRYVQCDEIWTFVQKKQRQVRDGNREIGDQWVFVAMDAETKLIASFCVGKRSIENTRALMTDLYKRLANQIQLTTDGFHFYTKVVEETFGLDVDFAQLVKLYGDYGQHGTERYSPSPIVEVISKVRIGNFDRARTLLEKSHYCIIAGIPGIGKTTLAEVLLADLVDRHGFEAFRVAHDLSELRSVKNSKRKQVFYFDDFLGKTALSKLEKNEDQRLVELVEEVASNPNWRFVLTTREYILNSAKLLYEAFAQPSIDFMLCIVNLADYTRPIRARILYNHIYFSGLPSAHKLALLEAKGYERILHHRNYNPRVIEYMTQTSHACSIPVSLYLSEFVGSLDHPTRIWDHAFRYQISEAARHLLLVLSTLPDDALLDDVKMAFWAFYRFRQSRFGFPTRSTDWSDALKQLDGNFINTRSVGKDIVVSLHNPSIRDFLWSGTRRVRLARTRPVARLPWQRERDGSTIGCLAAKSRVARVYKRAGFRFVGTKF